MSVRGVNGPVVGRGAANDFYFNADDSWKIVPGAPPEWEVVAAAAQPADLRREALVRRRRASSLFIALGLVLAAGAAIALGWSLTQGRRPFEVAPGPDPAAAVAPTSPEEASTSPPLAPSALASVAKPAPHSRSAMTGSARRHLQTADRRHAAATHAASRPQSGAAKHPKPHHSKAAHAARRSSHHAASSAHRPRHAQPAPPKVNGAPLPLALPETNF
jgi:hypothetical protein